MRMLTQRSNVRNGVVSGESGFGFDQGLAASRLSDWPSPQPASAIKVESERSSLRKSQSLYSFPEGAANASFPMNAKSASPRTIANNITAINLE